jgi:TonB family protein
MSPLTHLWESTLCAGVAALIALGLGRASARTRHTLWLFASLKFLLPFSALVLAGRYAGAWTSAFASAGASLAVLRIGDALPSWTLDVVAGPPALIDLSGAGFLVVAFFWATGAFLLAVRRWKQWRQLSALARTATRLQSGREIDALRRVLAPAHLYRHLEILECRSHVEPGVLGVFHPILLWPSGLSDRLEDDELDAILRHELSHVVRRDNLTALIHTVVETALWFHPAVWWIGNRLVHERERACDEEVMRMGTNDRSYAESILKVCGFCLRAPVAFVAGVGGSGLTERIERILGGPRPGPTRFARVSLAALAIAAAAAPFAGGVLNAHRNVATAAAGDQDQDRTIYRPGKGITWPKLVYEVKPQYTKEAMQARVEGSIGLQAVVLETGIVDDVTVVRSLDTEYGLDNAAVDALKQWRFEPATKDNKPVAVQVDIEMTFNLK